MNYYWYHMSRGGVEDAVVIIEPRDEKSSITSLLRFGDVVLVETLVAITREEALKLLN